MIRFTKQQLEQIKKFESDLSKGKVEFVYETSAPTLKECINNSKKFLEGYING